MGSIDVGYHDLWLQPGLCWRCARDTIIQQAVPQDGHHQHDRRAETFQFDHSRYSHLHRTSIPGLNDTQAPLSRYIHSVARSERSHARFSETSGADGGRFGSHVLFNQSELYCKALRSRSHNSSLQELFSDSELAASLQPYPSGSLSCRRRRAEVNTSLHSAYSVVPVLLCPSGSISECLTSTALHLGDSLSSFQSYSRRLS